jgi:hypothetical protein
MATKSASQAQNEAEMLAALRTWGDTEYPGEIKNAPASQAQNEASMLAMLRTYVATEIPSEIKNGPAMKALVSKINRQKFVIKRFLDDRNHNIEELQKYPYRFLCYKANCAETTTNKDECSRHWKSSHPNTECTNSGFFQVRLKDWMLDANLQATYSCETPRQFLEKVYKRKFTDAEVEKYRDSHRCYEANGR